MNAIVKVILKSCVASRSLVGNTNMRFVDTLEPQIDGAGDQLLSLNVVSVRHAWIV